MLISSMIGQALDKLKSVDKGILNNNLVQNALYNNSDNLVQNALYNNSDSQMSNGMRITVIGAALTGKAFLQLAYLVVGVAYEVLCAVESVPYSLLNIFYEQLNLKSRLNDDPTIGQRIHLFAITVLAIVVEPLARVNLVIARVCRAVNNLLCLIVNSPNYTIERRGIGSMNTIYSRMESGGYVQIFMEQMHDINFPRTKVKSGRSYLCDPSADSKIERSYGL